MRVIKSARAFDDLSVHAHVLLVRIWIWGVRVRACVLSCLSECFRGSLRACVHCACYFALANPHPFTPSLPLHPYLSLSPVPPPCLCMCACIRARVIFMIHLNTHSCQFLEHSLVNLGAFRASVCGRKCAQVCAVRECAGACACVHVRVIFTHNNPFRLLSRRRPASLIIDSTGRRSFSESLRATGQPRLDRIIGQR
jgi:hypothetical protein